MNNVAILIPLIPIAIAAKFIYQHIKNKRDTAEQEKIDAQIIGSKDPKIKTKDKEMLPNNLGSRLYEIARQHANSSSTDMIFGINSFNINEFDFSPSSLRLIDKWLILIWDNESSISEEMLSASLYWAASYIGEVIIQNARDKYSWIHYEEYMEITKGIMREMIPQCLEYQFILLGPNNYAIFPFSKVSKFMENGPEECVEFFALPIIAK